MLWQPLTHHLAHHSATLSLGCNRRQIQRQPHGINNAPSVITDVANGAVSSTSSDAINGSQLYGVSDYIADAPQSGNAVVNTDGEYHYTDYAIAGSSYKQRR